VEAEDGEAEMNDYMQMGVKPLIETFPEVGRVLERYGIACVQCTAGTCKLAEVLQLHALAPEDGTELMRQIAEIVDPTGTTLPAGNAPRPGMLAPVEPPRPAQFTYSPPVQRLVDEHAWIVRLLARIPDVVDEMDRSGNMDGDLLRAMVDFIRGYADRYHHMKEEDILFDYTDRETPIVQVILQDHECAREYVRAIVQATEEGDRSALCANLTRYRELLTEHITKEDEVLYPSIDRGLTTHQVGEMWQRFEGAESGLEADVPQKYERFITDLESRFIQ
jgi:hemerythrin-like domain-containing protein